MFYINFSAYEQSLLKDMIQAHPQLYLDETQDWCANLTGRDMSTKSIWNYLSRMGLTHKQLNAAAHERNEKLRKDYREFVSQFQPDMFVFVDESSKNSRTPQRTHGYLPKGSWNKPYKCKFVRQDKLSVMAALDYYGILGHMIVEGSYTAELFNVAFSMEVLPYLGSFLHQEERSIVVLDNCRVHDLELVRMIRQKGAMALFLPPYSPDLMPIEFAFHFLKCWLRRHSGFAAQHPKMSVSRALEDISETVAQNYIHSCGY